MIHTSEIKIQAYGYPYVLYSGLLFELSKCKVDQWANGMSGTIPDNRNPLNPFFWFCILINSLISFGYIVHREVLNAKDSIR